MTLKKLAHRQPHWQHRLRKARGWRWSAAWTSLTRETLNIHSTPITSGRLKPHLVESEIAIVDSSAHRHLVPLREGHGVQDVGPVTNEPVDLWRTESNARRCPRLREAHHPTRRAETGSCHLHDPEGHPPRCVERQPANRTDVPPSRSLHGPHGKAGLAAGQLHGCPPRPTQGTWLVPLLLDCKRHEGTPRPVCSPSPSTQGAPRDRGSLCLRARLHSAAQGAKVRAYVTWRVSVHRRVGVPDPGTHHSKVPCSGLADSFHSKASQPLSPPTQAQQGGAGQQSGSWVLWFQPEIPPQA